MISRWLVGDLAAYIEQNEENLRCKKVCQALLPLPIVEGSVLRVESSVCAAKLPRLS